MKNKRNHIVLIVLLAMVLLVGCGGNNSLKETAAPAVSVVPAKPAEPVTSPEAVIVHPENTVPPSVDTPVSQTETTAPNAEAIPEHPSGHTHKLLPKSLRACREQNLLFRKALSSWMKGRTLDISTRFGIRTMRSKSRSMKLLRAISRKEPMKQILIMPGIIRM